MKNVNLVRIQIQIVCYVKMEIKINIISPAVNAYLGIIIIRILV
jgi:hypothetical protein